MKPQILLVPLSLAALPCATAGDFIWRGATSNAWTDFTNWDVTTAPPVSPDDHPVPGTDYTSDRLLISNAAGNGAVYDPGAGVTTTFRSGRGLVIGSSGNSGNLTVTSGTIAVANAGGSGQEPIMANGVSASLTINGGAIDTLQSGATFRLINTDSGLANTSTLTLSSGSFSATGLDLYTAGSTGSSTVNLDGGTLTINRFTKTSTAALSTLNLDGGTLRARVSLTTTTYLPDLAGLQAIVEDGGVTVDSNTFSLTIAEVLEHDSTLGSALDGGLTKNGRGNLTLSGANTFNGGVIINGGIGLATGETNRLLLGNDSAAGTGGIRMADGFSDLQLSLNRNIANPLTISDTGAEKTLIFVNAGAAQYSGSIDIQETNIDHFRVRSDVNCNLTLSGKISGAGGIYKFQVGNTTITNPANDFTGGVKINQGTLTFANGALATTGAITMDGGTLRWDTGNTQDLSSRLTLVDGKNATFNTNGSNVTFASAIGNSSTANLIKSGTGTLTLALPATYSGSTTITGGTLAIGAPDVIPATAITLGAATLSAGSFSDTLGTLDPSAAATLHIDAGGTLAFADSSAVDWTAGTLNITGPFVSGSSIRFGSSSGALTPTQLGQITINGMAGSYTLDASGYLTAPVTGGYAAWQSANLTTQASDLDHDFDGVSNGIEFFLGGNTNTTGFTALPAVTENAGNLTITWAKHPDYTGTYNSGFVVETSTTLTGTWTVAALGAAADEVVISGNNITYTFPTGTRKFARLRVTTP
ncbi:MAG: autotransporter-associated beta strand repeat-containing protein [Akkermansiaceae bacterium]|jgi:autotransporter-associated beta strand protein|nr:autotransporter-associated beta strand repeat-containing protein [Akkermansiaceae bacterium]